VYLIYRVEPHYFKDMGLTTALLEVKMNRNDLGLNVGVLNREMSSWQRCPLREVPLYYDGERCSTGIYLPVLPWCDEKPVNCSKSIM
jgi:hypothetical protein